MEYLGNGYFRMVINGFITVGKPEDIKNSLKKWLSFMKESQKNDLQTKNLRFSYKQPSKN